MAGSVHRLLLFTSWELQPALATGQERDGRSVNKYKMKTANAFCNTYAGVLIAAHEDS